MRISCWLSPTFNLYLASFQEERPMGPNMGLNIKEMPNQKTVSFSYHSVWLVACVCVPEWAGPILVGLGDGFEPAMALLPGLN